MNILIVDDEALARQRLARMLAELGPPYRLAGEVDVDSSNPLRTIRIYGGNTAPANVLDGYVSLVGRNYHSVA